MKTLQSVSFEFFFKQGFLFSFIFWDDIMIEGILGGISKVATYTCVLTQHAGVLHKLNLHLHFAAYNFKGFV